MQQHRDNKFLLPLITVRKKNDPTDVRLNNRVMIFSLLYPNATFSRAEISRQTGLSRIAVSEVVADMIGDGLLTEIGQENPSRRGKKGTLISIDTQYWNIISIDLSNQFMLKGAVTNLQGQILVRVEQLINNTTTITPQTIISLCEQLIAKTNGNILGIGIAVSGIVDTQGIVIDSQHIHWENVPIKVQIEQHFPYPCFVDNDVNSAALAERFFGKGSRNMMFIQISYGVGAAIIIDDSLILGSHHAAGEIGHVSVNNKGPLCSCGKKGCLERYIATDILQKQLIENPQNRKQILQQAGTYLGDALSVSVNLLNINDIAIYGPADIVNDIFLKATSNAINNKTTSPTQPYNTVVRRSECGENINILGENISVLQYMITEF